MAVAELYFSDRGDWRMSGKGHRYELRRKKSSHDKRVLT